MPPSFVFDPSGGTIEPADANDPCSLSAVDLAAGYRSGRFTPSDVLDRLLARLAVVNPRINGVVTVDEAGARDAARASTERWRRGAALSPLDGVPISIKDNLYVAGMRATWGSRLYENFVPDTDELPVGRLRDAGAVLFGKTNAPELTVTAHTTNDLFGTTLNPLALDRTAGGSSGGAAAAVAAGLGPLAIGTDGGGSLRRPAAHCGLFAFRPSPGQVARAGGFPVILHDFETVGPLARSIDDLALCFDALRGYHPHDPRSLVCLGALSEPATARIAYVPLFGTAPVDPFIAQTIDHTVSQLSDSGFDISRQDAPFDVDEVGALWSRVAAAGVAWLLGAETATDVTANTAALAQSGRAVSTADYIAALDTVRRLRTQAADFWGRFDIMITPATASLAWPATESFPPTIAGRNVGPRGHAVYNGWANVVAACGATIPVAKTLDAGGIGLQVLGPYGCDLSLMANLRKLCRALGRETSDALPTLSR